MIWWKRELGALQYFFLNVIDQINVVDFISKSINNRIDFKSFYIISCTINLFAGDISEKLFVLATHTKIKTIKSGLMFRSRC